jgi:NADH-quinone oxidoreductase subunit N
MIPSQAAVQLHAFGLMIPEMILGLAACVVFLGSTFRGTRDRWALVSLAAIVAAAIALAYTPVSAPGTASDAGAGPLVNDALAALIRWLAIMGGLVLIVLGWSEVQDQFAGEYFGCQLVIIAGLMLTAMANDLVTLFLALELVSIPTYVLLYLPRVSARAQEAAAKYFLLSVLSSALLMFGFSFLYGIVGTTSMPAIVTTLGREPRGLLPPVVLIALITIVAGMGFRISAVPFHYYAPDVYEGGPTAVIALLAFLPKAAGFIVLVRLLGLVWSGSEQMGPALGDQAAVLLWIISVVTMTLGNVMALLQHNVKRLLAYSSIAHSGYMLIGLTVAYPAASAGDMGLQSRGVAATLFYLMAYAAMTVGAFGVLSYLSTPERPIETEDDLRGLSESRPAVAGLMALFLFSLIGIPLTGGFAGKLLLIWNALADRGDYASLLRWLAIIAIVNSAIGAYYYLRILAGMYLQTSARPPEGRQNRPVLVALCFCAAATIYLGVMPATLVERATRAVMPAEAGTQPSASVSGPAGAEAQR